MGRPRVQHHCIHCGKPCPQRGRRNGGFGCIDCAVKRYEESHAQIAAGEGEYYDRWLAGLGRAMDRKRAEAAEKKAAAEQAGSG